MLTSVLFTLRVTMTSDGMLKNPHVQITNTKKAAESTRLKKSTSLSTTDSATNRAELNETV